MQSHQCGVTQACPNHLYIRLYLADIQFKILLTPLCSADSNECHVGNGGCEHKQLEASSAVVSQDTRLTEMD